MGARECTRISKAASDAPLVFAGAGIDFDLVADGAEQRHLHREAGVDFRRLEHLARRVAADRGFGVDDFADHGVRQFD